MANIFSQMFSQFGPAPAQRADQGGGEYTGFIPDVYEGDDSMPSPIGTTGMGQTVNNYRADAQRAVLAKRRAELLAGRQAEGGAQPNVLSKPMERSVLTDELPVTVHAPDGSTPYVPRVATPTIADAAVTPGATSAGTSWLPMDIAKKAGGLVPEAMWDLGFGAIESIMKNVQRDFDQGGGALDPTSQNNYVQQLIKAGANDETIARLMDKYMPIVKSAIPNLQNNEWLATQFDEYMPKLEGAGNEIVQFARDQGNLYSSFYGSAFNKAKDTIAGWMTPDDMQDTQPSDPAREIHAGPFNPQHMELRAGQFEDFTGEAHNAVANPLMGNSVIIPQDQSWSGGFMDQPPRLGLNKPGWLERSPLGQMFKDPSETSDIVDDYYGDINPITRKPRQTAKEKLTDLGEGAGSIVDAVKKRGPNVAGIGVTVAAAKLAYDQTPVGKLRKKLKTAPDVSARGEMNKEMIQREIDRLKATKWDRWKAKLPKGMRGINKGKMLALVAAGAGLWSVADWVLAAGGGDEDVATNAAMDFLDRHPELLIGIDIATDPTGAALGGSEVLSKRMGPASENYWATPGIGRAAGGTADPTWRN